MNEKQLLIGREFNYNQGRVNWYTALHKLQEYKSVMIADFYNTCSSAGDWEGYFVQRIKNTNYFIRFYQENNYPHAGFIIRTGEVEFYWSGELTRQSVESFLSDALEMDRLQEQTFTGA